MSLVDAMIAIGVLSLAVVGYQRGLIASALPLAGFVGGAVAGSRIGQALLAEGAESEYAPLAAVVGGIVLGAFVAVALDGIAAMLRSRLGRGRLLGAVDGAGGASLLGVLGLVLAWALGAVALHTPGPETREVREAVQRSKILATLNGVMPPSGPLLNVLRRIDPRPEIEGPAPRVGPPEPGIANDPEVERAASSTVRVLGTACGLGVAGSGWVAGPGLVVTNAHVVAGQDDTTVSPPGGGSFAAEAVHYAPRHDLAVLRAPGLPTPALELAGSPRRGAAAAAIGYPDNGPLTVTPARLGATTRVTSQDAYGRGPVDRPMTSFRGRVRRGNSGGPVVGAGGDVLTTVFAASQGSRPASGLGVPNRIVRGALRGPLEPTDTGPCAA